MERSTILRCLEELENKLAELRKVVDRLPDAAEAPQTVRFVVNWDLGSLNPFLRSALPEGGV